MPRTLDCKAAIWAGIVAGVVFMMMEMLLVQFFTPMSMWAPPRMIAAIVLGEGVLPPPETFSARILMAAMIVHFVLSLIYAFILAWIVSRWHLTRARALIAATVFGLAIYGINFYGFTAVFPWFAEARGWIAIVSHAMFGLALGAVYEPLARQHEQARIGEAAAGAAAASAKRDGTS